LRHQLLNLVVATIDGGAEGKEVDALHDQRRTSMGAIRRLRGRRVPHLRCSFPRLGTRRHREVAQQVVGTIEPSSLDAVLATRYPVAVPRGWKTVSADGVAASVPPSWPVKVLPLQHPASGTTACTSFLSSVVYLGHIRGSCRGHPA
jgi:hypothetical protein